MGTTWRNRASEFFALDDAWVRQPPRDAWRRDILIALVLLVMSAVGSELARSAGAMKGTHPVWQEYAGLAAMAATIAVRRHSPLFTALAASAVFFVVGVTMPDLAVQLPMQGLYFYALFSAMAWAADRRAALVVVGIVLVVMFGWLAWQFSIGRAVDEYLSSTEHQTSTGLISPVAAAVTYSFLVNILYFGGAVIGGQAAWRAARRSAALADQAEQLRAQAAELKEHAVVEERLRIARELHDVVAHHVSVMGVQAAAARRVLDVDSEAASDALASVESSARQAVTEMRALLGTLRQGERTNVDAPDRAPEPSVDAIPTLVDMVRGDGLDVSYSVVTEPNAALARLSPALGLTLYRTVQEALHNIRRHSTARSATVVLRVDETAPKGGFAEVEVLDSGRPRTGTSGTGLGLLGMRERVASLDGSLEIGPRATGGFRVRVRLPLGADRHNGMPAQGNRRQRDPAAGMGLDQGRSKSTRRPAQPVEFRR